MASPLSSRQDTPSRTWWPLSKPTEKDLRQTYPSDKPFKSSSGFSFASVIGFKSKKHRPSLAIQHPPLQGPPTLSPSLTVDTPDPPTKFLNRLPSKSVSSTRSGDDSIAPRTPTDIQRDGRQSLLTLSDLDPFAGRTMVSLGSVHTMSDPNHLSVSEFVQKQLGATQMQKQDRVSYASSSSNSQYLSNDGSLTSMSPLAIDGGLQKGLGTKSSYVSLRRKALFVAPEGHDDPKAELLRSTSPMDKKQLASSPRSVMRARGNTDDGSGQRAGFFTVTNPSQPRPSRSGSASSRRPSAASQQRPASAPRPSSASRTTSTSRPSSTSRSSSSQKRSSSSQPAPLSTSPRVVIRQPSTSRISLPPSAPPTHELPATPALVVDKESRLDAHGGLLPFAESASSSTLSFASSLSSTRETLTQPRPRSKSTRASDRDLFQNPKEVDPDTASLHSISRVTQTPNTSTRTLREVISHQSLRRRAQPSLSTESYPAFETTNEKVPRKRRSFHNPRLPMPPIPLPLRHASSYNSSMSSPTIDTSSVTLEQGRGNASSSSGGRKRLFSSNRRPSTSQCFPSEDDTQSIFSVRSDQETSTGTSFFKPWISARASSQSSFWEEGASDAAPSVTRVEYTPQHIMSPAEIAEVEASVENTPNLYARQRVLSLLSATSDTDQNDTPSGLSPPPPMRLKAKQSSHPTNKSITDTSAAPPPKHDYLPSTTHPVISPLSASSDEDDDPIYRPSSSPPSSMASLPPPPRPRQKGALVSQPGLSVNSPPLPPPARKDLMRSNTSVEKMIHRRSIMRKSSFLEIDDDTDKDTDVEITDSWVSGSFLDLARESFDTVRSGQ